MTTDLIKYTLEGTGYHGGEECTVNVYHHDDTPDIFVLSATNSDDMIALDRRQIQLLLELSQP